jgi:cyclic pyranopterin phosphate synthase
MPREGINFQNESAMLTRQEIARSIDIAAQCGIQKIRFTGGEPLMRKDICDLVETAALTKGIKSVHLTTNGLLLHQYLQNLVDSGLNGINISLDSLHAARYLRITRRESFKRVWKNVLQTLDQGSLQVKLNVVALSDMSESEIMQFVTLTKDYPLTVRFIELMPFHTNSGAWQRNTFTSAAHVLGMLKCLYPELQNNPGSSTEQHHFSLTAHKGHVAVIPAYTRTMCAQCSRLRLTSNGQLLSCLYSKRPLDLKTPLRTNNSDAELMALFDQAITQKPQNGISARQTPETRNICMTQIGG